MSDSELERLSPAPSLVPSHRNGRSARSWLTWRRSPSDKAARFLLKPGRKYEQAVKEFEPYQSIKEMNSEAKAAGHALIAEGQAAGPRRRTFVFVNKRLEGNALETIAAMAGVSQ